MNHSQHQEKIFFPVFLDLSAKKIVVVGGGSIAERRILTLYGFAGSITIIAPEITDLLQTLSDPHLIQTGSKPSSVRNLLHEDRSQCSDDHPDHTSINDSAQDNSTPNTSSSDTSSRDNWKPSPGSKAQQTPVIWKKKKYERSDIMDADLVLACTSDPDLNNDIYVACKCLGILVNDCSDKNKCDFYFPSIVQKDNVVVGINGSGADHHQVKVIRQKIEQALQCDHSLYREDAACSAGRDDEGK
ncbi:MAG: bifunctional precorrin-2 dehydrogenase/sirohydrochlorin ferrochelatase [Bilifractor sp.]